MIDELKKRKLVLQQVYNELYLQSERTKAKIDMIDQMIREQEQIVAGAQPGDEQPLNVLPFKLPVGQA